MTALISYLAPNDRSTAFSSINHDVTLYHARILYIYLSKFLNTCRSMYNLELWQCYKIHRRGTLLTRVKQWGCSQLITEMTHSSVSFFF